MKLWHQAMAEVDYLARKLASAACCDEENLVQEKKEQYREVYLMNEKQDQVGVSLSMQGAEQDPYLMQVVVPEVSGKKAEAETMEEEKVTRIEKVQLDKAEMKWCGKVPLLINRQESVSLSKQGSHPDVLQGEGPEVADMKAEARIVMDKLPSAQGEAVQLRKKEQELGEERKSKEEMDLEAEWIESRSKENFAEAGEQPDFKKLMLRQLNLNTKEVEKHVNAKQMKAETEAEENRMQLKVVKQSLKEEKVTRSRGEKDLHKLSLVTDQLVPPEREGSGAEAEALVSVGSEKEIGAKDSLDEDLVDVSVSKKVGMRLKLMGEKMELLKQCLKLKACEEDGNEAPPLLVDKQAAAIG